MVNGNVSGRDSSIPSHLNVGPGVGTPHLTHVLLRNRKTEIGSALRADRLTSLCNGAVMYGPAAESRHVGKTKGQAFILGLL